MNIGKQERHPVDIPVTNDTKDEWKFLINSLRGDQLLLVWAHYCEDWSLEDLGDEFGLTKQAVQYRIKTAINILKKKIMKHCPNIKSKLRR